MDFRRTEREMADPIIVLPVSLADGGVKPRVHRRKRIARESTNHGCCCLHPHRLVLTAGDLRGVTFQRFTVCFMCLCHKFMMLTLKCEKISRMKSQVSAVVLVKVA